MKNLFDYATKELAQDAFLAWLISSAKQKKKDYDEESYIASRMFLKKVANIDEDDEITDITIRTQLEKIDIAAFITTKNRGRVGLFIEDKVKSVEHNQLEDYNAAINKNLKNWDLTKNNIEKCYFKPFYIEKDEYERVEKAGWTPFFYKYVIWFFSTFKKFKNIILKQYAQHIDKIYYQPKNTKLPIKSLDKPLCWKGFFNLVIAKSLKEDFKCEVTNTYSSATISITPKAIKYPFIPNLYMVSDECNNGCIKAYISIKDVKYDKRSSYNDKLSLLDTKYFSAKPYKSKSKQKVIASSKVKPCKYNNKDEFINIAKALAYEYKKLFYFKKSK